MKKTLQLIKDVFFSPDRIYKEIDQKSKWIGPFLIYSLSSICISTFWHIYVYRSMQGVVQRASSGNSIDLMVKYSRRAVCNLLSIPIEHFLLLLVTTIFLWLILKSISDTPIRIKKCLSLTAHSSILLLLLPITFILIVLVKSSFHNLGNPYNIHLGLDFFFQSFRGPKWIMMALSQMNVFNIIWLVFIIRGANNMCEIKKSGLHVLYSGFIIFWLLLGISYSKIKFLTL